MRSEKLDAVLNELNSGPAGIEASAVISIDGLIIASRLPQGVDEDRVGARSAAMMTLGEQTIRDLARGGTLRQVMIAGEQGIVLMANAGPDAVLTVLAGPLAQFDALIGEVRRAAETVAAILG
jgi:uncharacterized protein